MSVVIILWQFSICNAEEKIIEAEGVCVVEENSNDIFAGAKEKAKCRALRLAVDKAGVYVESYSRRENHHLTADEVRIIGGEIIHIKNVKYLFNKIERGKTECRAFVEVLIDTDNISRQIEKDKDKLKILKARTVTLRKDYESLKLENEKFNSSEDYKLFSLYQKAADKNNDFEDREKNVQEILRINANYRDGIAYALRAELYNEQLEYSKALENDLKYLEFNRSKSEAYYFCALDYQNLNDFENAIMYIFLALDYEPDNYNYMTAAKYISLKYTEKG